MATRLFQKRTGRVIDRRTAQVAEENFFERFASSVTQSRGLLSPLDGRAYDFDPAHRTVKTLDTRTEALKALIKRTVARDLLKTYDEMPRGGTMIFELAQKGLLGGRDPRVVVAGAALSPVEELLRSAGASSPIGATDLAKVRDEICVRPDVFYFVCAFSTTSWDPDARNTLSGPNVLMALCDYFEDTWRVIFGPDPRWECAPRLFDLTTYEEKVDAVRRFVERHTFELLMDELTETFVAEELGLSLGVVREAFEIVEDQSDFLRLETGVQPFRLARVYA